MRVEGGGGVGGRWYRVGVVGVSASTFHVSHQSHIQSVFSQIPMSSQG